MNKSDFFLTSLDQLFKLTCFRLMKMVNDDDDDGNGDNDNNKMCENRIRKFGNFMVLYQKLVS